MWKTAIPVEKIISVIIYQQVINIKKAHNYRIFLTINSFPQLWKIITFYM